MNKITGLKESQSPGKRVSVFLDGKFAFSLPAEMAAGEGLRIGQELTPEQAGRLAASGRFQRCRHASSRLLSYRPRSEAEIRDRLRRQGFEDDHVEAVLRELSERQEIDDAAFARFWTEERETFSPRSRRLISRELKQKGIDAEIIRQVVATVDEDDSAYRSAAKKSRQWAPDDYRQFHRKLCAYLQRRGFSHEVAGRAARRIWQERGNAALMEAVPGNTETGKETN